MSETLPATGDLSGAYSQTGRSIAIDTPLGPDALLLTSVQGEDKISCPFVYTVEFLTMAADSAVRGLIGKRVTLWLQNNHESWRRPVNGYVRRITGQPTGLRGYGGYRAEVVPRLWFLDCTADCRIFQTMTYPAIIKTLLDENGVTGCDFKLLKTDYPTVDYCVQYRESALAFISRLMEHVGIFFFHEHSAADHKLVITDANSFTKVTTPRQLRTAVGAEVGDIQKVWSDTTFKPGAWVLTDYDFEAPSKLMKKQVKTTLAVAMMPQHEWFDFPGGYTDQDVGTWLTRIRMEAEEAHHDKLLGLGSTAVMDPGHRFDLVHSGSADDQAASYLITEVRHRAEERSYFQEQAAEYYSEFVAIPAATPFRPERVTPKSVVRGSQTATVVSPSSGDPIYTDEYGRVKVHFHWDRRGKRSTGATSCWVRVSQNSAGAGFGGIAIPHAGQEVIVDFLEGDPDRPLIVGRVHNAEKVSPINLPADKHKTITRDHGGNKFVMYGEGGSQHMSLVAPKTLNFIVAPDIAKSLSAGASVASSDMNQAKGQLFGTSPGLADLQEVTDGLKSENDSAPSTDHCINTVAKNDSNTFIGRDSNTYTIGITNSWTGGRSHTKVEGFARSQFTSGTETLTYYSCNTQVFGVNDSLVTGNNTSVTLVNSVTAVGGYAASKIALFNKSYVGGWNTSTVRGTNTSTVNGKNKSTVLGTNYSLTDADSTIIVKGTQHTTVSAKETNTNQDVETECEAWTVKSKKAGVVDAADDLSLKGKNATLEGKSGKVLIKASGEVQIMGSNVTYTADGTMKLKGGTLLLN